MENPIKQFEKETRAEIKKMGNQSSLRDLARAFIKETSAYRYSYHFSWLGRPIIQYPQDILTMQEIIWNVKPDVIIETGIAHGGGLIFYASLLELLKNGFVIGVDNDIRAHNRKEIEMHNLSGRIRMIEGSSIDPDVIKQIKRMTSGCKTILVCLDSFHTQEHVRMELELFAPLVSKGSYIVVFDTVIEYMPKGFFKNRPWDKGNNPATAVRLFLKTNKTFIADREIDNKLLISVAPGGYLKKIA